jgi:GTP1/Obg family GTP-binding protein
MENVIINLNYSHLRNEAHVELHDTVNDLFIKYPPPQLGIMPQYLVYKPLYDEELTALDVVRKSGYTDEVDEQDHVRDHVYRGFDDAVKSALNHFDATKREAAKRVKIVLDNYGNIAAKTLDQETAAIDDLLREYSSGSYPALIDTLTLNDWLKQLDIENRHFKDLMLARYDETAQRPTTHMKAARGAVDKAFRDMTKQLEALARVNGFEAYKAFFHELNAVLERYKKQI